MLPVAVSVPVGVDTDVAIAFTTTLFPTPFPTIMLPTILVSGIDEGATCGIFLTISAAVNWPVRAVCGDTGFAAVNALFSEAVVVVDVVDVVVVVVVVDAIVAMMGVSMVLPRAMGLIILECFPLPPAIAEGFEPVFVINAEEAVGKCSPVPAPVTALVPFPVPEVDAESSTYAIEAEVDAETAAEGLIISFVNEGIVKGDF